VNLLLGVSGGIAAYKAAELCSLAVKAGHTVRVVQTRNAQRFVGAATFEGLTGHPVLDDTFADAMAHIDQAKWAHVACVAPLTANTLAKLACGLADDALSTTWLALPGAVPVVLAPAMNTEMWNHPLVQRNLGWLLQTGRHHLVEPTSKRLACGDVGVGALADPADILVACEALALRP
jgi:phosphopantothenoylcysteine decarboxylase / phosphopantothenate---cysteine ligase